MFHCKSFVPIAVALFTVGQFATVQAADHLDAPLLSGRGQADINDIYIFQSPADSARSVLIMTVNPFAGVLSSTTFDSNLDYEFQIDNDGDAAADVTYNFTFTAASAGVQNFATTRTEGANTLSYATGTTETNIPTGSGGMLRAGLFDDPFYFDLAGFQNGFAFTGDDAFAGMNVSAIVLEVPNTELGPNPNVGLWARTVDQGQQVDRMGRPAINTVLIPSARKDEFNQADPADDLTNFGADVEAAITGLSDATNAAALTPILLPDILTYDFSNAGGFLNGRRLEDDVIDAELNLLSGGAVTTDMVDANDVAFLDVFPYLGSANVIIPEPSSMLLAAVTAALLSGMMWRRRRSHA